MLLEAADQIARNEGLEALTIARLAKVSGYSEGTMYRYFPTKEALLLALEERAWQSIVTSFMQRLAAVPRGAPLAASIRALVEASANDMSTSFGLYGAVFLHDAPLEIANLRRAHLAKLVELVSEALLRRQSEIAVPPEIGASVAIVAAVVLARIGPHVFPKHAEAWNGEVADLVTRYLVRP